MNLLCPFGEVTLNDGVVPRDPWDLTKQVFLPGDLDGLTNKVTI